MIKENEEEEEDDYEDDKSELSFTLLCNKENLNDLNELNINVTSLTNRIKEFASDDFYTKQFESLSKPNKFLADENQNIKNFSEIKPDEKNMEDPNRSILNSFLGLNKDDSLSRNKFIWTENKENDLLERRDRKIFETDGRGEMKNKLFSNWEHLNSEKNEEKKNLSLLDSFSYMLKSPKRSTNNRLFDENEKRKEINRLLDFKEKEIEQGNFKNREAITRNYAVTSSIGKSNDSSKMELIQNARSKVEKQFELLSKKGRDSNRS